MKQINLLFDTIFSKYSRRKFEKFILVLAALGFVTHLVIILLNSRGYINFDYDGNLLSEHDLLASENIKKMNIISRILKSINYLIWGDV